MDDWNKTAAILKKLLMVKYKAILILTKKVVYGTNIRRCVIQCDLQTALIQDEKKNF